MGPEGEHGDDELIKKTPAPAQTHRWEATNPLIDGCVPGCFHRGILGCLHRHRVAGA